MRVRNFTLWLLLVTIAATAMADTDSLPRLRTFQGENDSLVPDGSDDSYTNGLRYSEMVSLNDGTPTGFAWARTIEQLWCGGRDFKGLGLCDPDESRLIFAGWSIGQSIYTPNSISEPIPDPEDRPYAGYLYGSAIVDIVDERRRCKRWNLEGRVGVIGSAGLGEIVQTKVHRLIDDERPMGWDSQLRNELTVNLNALWQGSVLRLGNRDDESCGHEGTYFDVVPHAGVMVGTVMTGAVAGGTFRLGYNITGLPILPIGNTALAPAEPPDFEIWLFGGVEGRALARNIFLDGNTFVDSASVDKETFVYDLRAGLSLRLKDVTVTYTYVRRSEEFNARTGLEDIHEYGSLSVQWTFP
ncbi:MAG: lipid A deacylase LpxR family protein [Acidobacteriota bacterium]